jgi:hydrogenase-1 operon protein HyaF
MDMMDAKELINCNGVGSDAMRALTKPETPSGNIKLLLHEIRHAVWRLLNEGTCSCIDLKGIPLVPGEEEGILQALGQGEARAQLRLFGASELIETSFPGVWVVTHYDARGDIQARFVEVTRVPPILCSQTADIADGLMRLAASLGVDAGYQASAVSSGV